MILSDCIRPETGTILRAARLLLVMVSVAVLPATAQELPATRVVVGTGTYEGELTGNRSYLTYAGDRVIETIQCAIRMTFHPGGEVSWESGDYRYEKQYIKYDRATGQELLKAVTTIQSEPSRSDAQRPPRSTLKLTVTTYRQPPLVRGANWPPVWVPAKVQQQTTLRGRPGPIQVTDVSVYCEPYIRWRGADGQGEGLELTGSYNGPDGLIAKAWVRYQGENGPPKNKRDFRETTNVRVVWRLRF